MPTTGALPYKLSEPLIAQRVMADRINVFAERTLAASITSPLGTLLLAWVQAAVAGWWRAAIWLVLINLIELMIIGIGYRYKAAMTRGENPLPYLRWMFFGEFLVGLAWGSSVWFFWTDGQFIHHLLNLTILVGVSGICIVIMSPFLLGMALFTGGVLLLPIIHLAFVPGDLNLAIAIGLLILYVLELQYARVAEKQLTNGLYHAARHEELASELTQRTLALEATKIELNRAQTVGNVGSWVYDIPNDVMRLSDETCRIYGLGKGVAGNHTSYLEHVHLQDRNAVDRAWQEALKGGVFDHEHRIMVGDVIRWVRQKAEIEYAADGMPLTAVGITQDITERKVAEDEIDSLAFYDSLTELPNRRLLLDRLKHALASSTRNHRYCALLFIDLDSFKTLNDTLGHATGDMLLQQVGHRLAACVRGSDTVARFGGDEFVILLEDLSQNAQESAAQAEIVGEKIIAELGQPYWLANQQHQSTASMGITLFVGNQGTVDDLLRRADLAMYQAKAAGRNTVRFFDPEMQAAVTTRAALEAGLREAVLKDQFLLHYQAQVNSDGCLTGVEALVRWQHPQRGLVPPDEFIPIAEETGVILPLGQWVLNTACVQLALWSARPDMVHLTVAVNVSARQFHQQNFVEQVLAVLERTGADASRLKLELTESLLVDDMEGVIAKMTALKARGVAFSLDDFGTGYSSLSHLKRLPLDQLKIDRGFVRDILTDPNDAAIAKMVVALAQSMGLAVIAEGVETEDQRDFLALHGCDAYQGYFFSRPLPIADFEAFAKQP